MKLFTVRLTDEERATLEGCRQRMGLRSEADVIRQWIRHAGSPPLKVVEQALSRIEPQAPPQQEAMTIAEYEKRYIQPQLERWREEETSVPFGPVKRKPGTGLKKR